MDWSRFGQHYIEVLNFVLYWIAMGIMVIAPLCGIVFLVYAMCEACQSMKNSKIDKELRIILEEADANGR